MAAFLLLLASSSSRCCTASSSSSFSSLLLGGFRTYTQWVRPPRNTGAPAMKGGHAGARGTTQRTAQRPEGREWWKNSRLY